MNLDWFYYFAVSLKNDMKMMKDQETDYKNQVRVLHAEVDSKNHDLQVLHKSIERLRKEKHLYLVNGLGGSNGEIGRLICVCHVYYWVNGLGGSNGEIGRLICVCHVYT